MGNLAWQTLTKRWARPRAVIFINEDVYLGVTDNSERLQETDDFIKIQLLSEPVLVKNASFGSNFVILFVIHVLMNCVIFI